MGFLRKITGMQGQIDAANRNAVAQEQAIEQSTQGTVASMNAAAEAAARQQREFAERQTAEAAAAAAVSLPLESAEVRLDEAPTQSATARRGARRRRFGQSAPTGVSI